MRSQASTFDAPRFGWIDALAWALTLPWMIVGFVFSGICLVSALSGGGYTGSAIALGLSGAVGLTGFTSNHGRAIVRGGQAARRLAAYLIVGIALAALLSVAFAASTALVYEAEPASILLAIPLSASVGFGLLGFRGIRRMRRLLRLVERADLDDCNFSIESAFLAVSIGAIPVLLSAFDLLV